MLKGELPKKRVCKQCGKTFFVPEIGTWGWVYPPRNQNKNVKWWFCTFTCRLKYLKENPIVENRGKKAVVENAG